MNAQGWIARLGTASLATLSLLGCGGDGIDVAGISGTGVTAAGAITAAAPDSISVNGVDYNIQGAEIIADLDGDGLGDPAAAEDLREGQIVTVEGTLEDQTTGSAQQVEFDRWLDGPISAIDCDADTVTALDQTIEVTDSTEFIDTTSGEVVDIVCEDLEPGNLIAVSGFMNGGGDAVATFVQRGASEFVFDGETDTEVEGIARVSSRQPANTFNIDDLVVDFSGAALMNAVPQDGDRVEVVGAQNTEGGTFFASRVQVRNTQIADPGRRVELEGIVSGFDEASGTFTLQGQPVDISDTNQPDAFSEGARVEVEGAIDDDGVLVAETVAVQS